MNGGIESMFCFRPAGASSLLYHNCSKWLLLSATVSSHQNVLLSVSSGGPAEDHQNFLLYSSFWWAGRRSWKADELIYPESAN